MARYGIATVFTDSWADALAAAHAELWRHRVVAHGELPILNPGPIVDSAEDLQPPMSFRCPRCSFRVVAFENPAGLPPEEEEEDVTDEEEEVTDEEVVRCWLDIIRGVYDRPESS